MADGGKNWPCLNSVVWAKIKVTELFGHVYRGFRDTPGGRRWSCQSPRAENGRGVAAASDVSFFRITGPLGRCHPRWKVE